MRSALLVGLFSVLLAPLSLRAAETPAASATASPTARAAAPRPTPSPTPTKAPADGAPEILTQTQCAHDDAYPQVHVDGSSGAVDYRGKKPLFEPGEAVCLVVYRANLAEYDYKLDVQSETIHVYHAMVGVAEPNWVTSGAELATTFDIDVPAFEEFVAAAAEALDKARQKAEKVRTGLQQEANELPREIELSCQDAATCAWPSADVWPQPSTATALAELETLTTTLEQHVFRLDNFVSLRLPARMLRPEKERGAWTESSASAAKNVVKDLSAKVKELTDLVGTLRATTNWWATVRATYPAPRIEVLYRLRRGNRRYTATLTRAPRDVDGITRTASAPSTSEPSVRWAFVFEAHERARFSVSVGLGGIHTPETKEYALLGVLDEKKVVHTVRQTQGPAVDAKFIATLGLYLQEVDQADVHRGPAPVVFIGTEVKTAPSAFLLGIGLDFVQGLQIGAGVTHYRSKELAPGWVDGMVVPSDDKGAPLIAAVPTVSKGKVGYFVGATFRPAIFGALKDLLKP